MSVTISTSTITDNTIKITGTYSNITLQTPYDIEYYIDNNIVFLTQGTTSDGILDYTYTGLSMNTTYSLKVIIIHTGTSKSVTSNTPTPTTTCYLKNTLILCDGEKYVEIQNLNKGDYIVTTAGNKKIIGIQKIIYGVTNKNELQKIYKLKQKNDPDLINDLLITGGHSILVDELTEEQINKMEKYFGKTIPKIGNKYKLLSCVIRKWR